MGECDICGKKMPKRVLEAHKKKRHSEAVEKVVTVVIGNFDWGRVEKCASCGEEYPAKAMPFHAHAKHGV